MRVVLAMHRNPLAYADSGCEPEGDPEREIGGASELDRAMRNAAMQIHRGAHVGESGDGQPCGNADQELDEQPGRCEEHVATIAVLPTGR